MNRIESHPDYQELQAAHEKLQQLAQSNQDFATAKLQQLGTSAGVERKSFENLKSQNEKTAKSIDRYFAEVTAALYPSLHTLAYVRNSKFSEETDAFLAQLELIELRLHAGTDGDVDKLELYQRQNRWHVSAADSLTKSMADFATIEEAKAHAVTLKRRFRILTFMSDN